MTQTRATVASHYRGMCWTVLALASAISNLPNCFIDTPGLWWQSKLSRTRHCSSTGSESSRINSDCKNQSDDLLFALTIFIFAELCKIAIFIPLSVTCSCQYSWYLLLSVLLARAASPVWCTCERQICRMLLVSDSVSGVAFLRRNHRAARHVSGRWWKWLEADLKPIYRVWKIGWHLYTFIAKWLRDILGQISF